MSHIKVYPYSIEYFHIYTDEAVGREHLEGLDHLHRLIGERQLGRAEYRLCVLVDDYSRPDKQFDYVKLLQGLEKRGSRPDYLTREHELTPAADEVLGMVADTRRRRGLLRYIDRKGYPCSLLTAAWHLARLGRLRYIPSSITAHAERLINILPERFRVYEDEARRIIGESQFSGSLECIENLYFSADGARTIQFSTDMPSSFALDTLLDAEELPATIDVAQAIHVAGETDIPDTAALDSQVMEGHVSLSEHELRHFRAHGGVLLALHDGTGRMIGEGQAVIRATPGASEPIARMLPPEAGYLEGYGVDPSWRNRKLGTALVRATESIMRHKHRYDILVTLRPENVASLHLLTREGYNVIAYAARYYESAGLAGARIVARKDLTVDSGLLPQVLATCGIAEEPATMQPTCVRVSVTPGDQPAAVSHRLISEALTQGLIGVGVTRETDGRHDLVFCPLDMAGDELAQRRLLETQRLLHELGISDSPPAEKWLEEIELAERESDHGRLALFPETLLARIIASTPAMPGQSISRPFWS